VYSSGEIVQTVVWFYEVFRWFPDQLLHLAGLPFEGHWHMESVTVKPTEKRHYDNIIYHPLMILDGVSGQPGPMDEKSK